MQRGRGRHETKFVYSRECFPPLDAVDDALRSVRLLWAAAEDGENTTGVEGRSEKKAVPLRWRDLK